MKHRRQRGVALAIVVWFLAAMSLLVAGTVFQVRVDTRMAQAHVARAKAVAAGDGAIQLMLGALKSNQFKGFRGRGIPSMDFTVGDHDVSVQLVPVAGLVDINGASKELLTMLFASQGNVSIVDAQLLADNVIKWRSQTSGKARHLKQFYSIEDLLRVDGINRTLLEGIQDAIVVGKKKRGRVDWLSAPGSVLVVLAGESGADFAAIREQQRGNFSPNQTLPRGLNPRFQLPGSGSDYRLDAFVTVGDKQWLRRRWVTVGSNGEGLLPWLFTATEAVRALGNAQ